MKIYEAFLCHENEHHFGKIEWDKTWRKFVFKPNSDHRFDGGDMIDLRIIIATLSFANFIIWWRYAPLRLWNSLRAYWR